MDANMFKYILIFIILLEWTHGCIYLGLDEEEENELRERLLEKRRRRIEMHEKERLRTEIRKIRAELDKQMSAQYKVHVKLRKRKKKLEEDKKYMREKSQTMSTQNTHADVDRENFVKLHKENENKIQFLGVKLEKLRAQTTELDMEMLKEAEQMETLWEKLQATGERCKKVEEEKEELKIKLQDLALVLLRPMEEFNETAGDVTGLDGNLEEGRGDFSEDSVKFSDGLGSTGVGPFASISEREFDSSTYVANENCIAENCTSVLSEDTVNSVDDSDESEDEVKSCGSTFSLSDDKTTTISTFPGKCSRDPPPSTCSSKFPFRDRSPSCPSHHRVSSH